MKADFFEIKSFVELPVVKLLLSDKTHHITDMFGTLLSKHGEEKLSSSEETLVFAPENLALLKLRAEQSIQQELGEQLSKELHSYVAGQIALAQEKTKELLWQDLDALLFLSEQRNTELNSLMQKLLSLLCTHIGATNASIFGMPDGFVLEFLAHIGKQPSPELANVAGIAVTTKNIHLQKEPAENFSEELLCYPILFAEVVLGVIVVSGTRTLGSSKEEVNILHRFSRVASHILQKTFLERKMKNFEKTSDQLGKYLSTKVVKNVKKVDSVELGGIEKKVVCLFCDIRSFTSITEGIPAPTLTKLLNFYFERMNAVIDKYEGTIDKIVGDLIMVVWNIPHDQPEPEVLATKAALEMQKEMIRHIAPEWAKHGVPKVGCGIGINSGLAVAGNLGSSHFMNYTVIGDTINTAQRLEAKAKAGEIWVAEELFPLLDGKVERPLRKETGIKLKGKAKELNAYVYHPLTY